MAKRFGLRSLGCVLILGISACQTLQKHELEAKVAPEVLAGYLKDKPENLKRLYAPILLQGKRNLVLNHVRIGIAAMEERHFDLAEASFDIALKSIETIYADNEEAEKALSLWTKENIKDFKGEPYERAMAYYYRGLLYLVVGDYENARASFKGGMLQDAFAADKQDRSDFAALAYLEGWASKCWGNENLAKDSFAEAVGLNAALSAPKPGQNLLAIFETGHPPQKRADGDSNEKLTFKRGPNSSEKKLRVSLAKVSNTVAPAEDIFYQASTRGGRPIDSILAGKVNFKDGANTVGDGLLVAGTATLAVSSNRNTAIAGAAMMFAGLVAKAAAAAAQPDADIRAWDNLPDKVFLTTFAQHDDSQNPTAHVLDAAGDVIAGSAVDLPIIGGDDACKFSWARNLSALAVNDRAPGSFVPEK
jgi:tetratricopeptide (TPR) repeat protein